MVSHDSPSVAASDEDATKELLVWADAYIVARVGKMMRGGPGRATLELLDLEIDEIAQSVRIKFWRALRWRHIVDPKAYIHRIVHNEFVDLVRRQKSTLPLESMLDPLDELEQEEAVASSMALVADDVLALPSRRICALVCTLRERVGSVLTTCGGVQRASDGCCTGKPARKISDLLPFEALLLPALILNSWESVRTNGKSLNTS